MLCIIVMYSATYTFDLYIILWDVTHRYEQIIFNYLASIVKGRWVQNKEFLHWKNQSTVCFLTGALKVSYLTKCTSANDFYDFKVISMKLHFLHQLGKWFGCLKIRGNLKLKCLYIAYWCKLSDWYQSVY